ncbi:MAG: type II toxin-antitoxin system RelE/ParE family toxin [Sphingomonadales bacterium]|nr:type II toxin-antitoxin system RelE/ParE family toxin [Sphingomonadales bacterium]MDE2171143.1 type II toxin-antitoxin system RelE/ParE family toxin [Sphingomonadales bacterium]
MILHLTRGAERDLEVIGDYIARDNPSRAITFIRNLRKSCLGLAEMPHRFPLMQGFEAAGVRRRLHGNYLIFFRVEREVVLVIHILHAASDYSSAVLGD